MAASSAYTVRLASRRQRVEYVLLVVGWLVTQAVFWSWWLRTDHVVTVPGMVVNSLLLLWTTFLPAWYLFFLGRTRQPNPALALPVGRVAMVVTKAPSEPWPLVQRTLEAMLAQKFPRAFDVWLADEDPSIETSIWCAEHGVKVSCRKGVASYNNPTWPRRARCKEGNLTYFYEVMGAYDRYDFVSQLDADHVPDPTYLAEIIRPFADPSVGYVAAPSVCDANASHSWAARGRLYAEAAWHGSVQSGFNGGFAPQLIGSHYAVRTRALREIGGLGPELAEDFSTTLAMNSAGWRGTFAINAAAHGDGPSSVSDCLVQEFQWSRSVVNIFLSLWSKQRRGLPLRVRVQLGFAQVWYFLFTLHLGLACLLPVIALASGSPWVNVDLPGFLLRASLPSAVAMLALAWTRRQGWLRPANAPILSWEAILFEFVRWPWMILGIGHAVGGRLLGTTFAFRVTPKGAAGAVPLPRRVLLPYVAIVLVEAGVAAAIDAPGAASGYLYLALMAAFSYCVVIGAVIWLHLRENHRAFQLARLAQIGSVLRATPAAAPAFGLLFMALMLRGEAAVAAIVPETWPKAPAVIVVEAPFAAPSDIVVEPVPAAQSGPTLVPPTRAPLPLDLPADHVSVGAYDPARALDVAPLDVELRYVRTDDVVSLEQFLNEVQDRRTPLVTIEPWIAGQTSGTTMLSDVVAGTSDASLRTLARAVADRQPQVVLVRWGHEMELSDVFPWGAQDPQLYVSAYRRVVDIFRQEGAVNARFVWSPAGNANAGPYYPGDDVVDYIGVTVLGDAAWDASFGLPSQSFDDVLGPRYRRLAGYGKPLIVAELGVSGTPVRQVEWLAAAPRVLAAYPNVRAVVYFNAPNPPVNGLPVQPDWRVAPTLLSRALQAVRSA